MREIQVKLSTGSVFFEVEAVKLPLLIKGPLKSTSHHLLEDFLLCISKLCLCDIRCVTESLIDIEDEVSLCHLWSVLRNELHRVHGLPTVGPSVR